MNTVTRRGANHGLHLVLSVLTCGVWAITGWPIAAVLGRRTTVTHPLMPLSPVQQQYGRPDPNHWYWDEATRSYQPR